MQSQDTQTASANQRCNKSRRLPIMLAICLPAPIRTILRVIRAPSCTLSKPVLKQPARQFILICRIKRLPPFSGLESLARYAAAGNDWEGHAHSENTCPYRLIIQVCFTPATWGQFVHLYAVQVHYRQHAPRWGKYALVSCSETDLAHSVSVFP